MANFVRSESVVRDAVNFCADSDVIEVSTDRVIIFKTSIGIERHMASGGTWFGETSRQSQTELVKQQHTGISPNHVPEAVPHYPLESIPSTKLESILTT